MGLGPVTVEREYRALVAERQLVYKTRASVVDLHSMLEPNLQFMDPFYNYSNQYVNRAIHSIFHLIFASQIWGPEGTHQPNQI